MGRGAREDSQSATLLYGAVAKRADFVSLLATSDPKAFYIIFERQFGERLLAYATERLKMTYPEPKYLLEVMLPGTGLPEESNFEEMLEEQDDDLYVSCHVHSKDDYGKWAFDCYDGFYMSVEELLGLGWHQEDSGLSERCRAHMRGRHAPAQAGE